MAPKYTLTLALLAALALATFPARAQTPAGETPATPDAAPATDEATPESTEAPAPAETETAAPAESTGDETTAPVADETADDETTAPAADDSADEAAPADEADDEDGIDETTEAPVEAVTPPKTEPEAPWSPFIDTRLTFVFADDNLLAGPGESDEPSPGAQFHADDRNNLFFESYDTKDSGFESLTHLVLYKETDTFFERLRAAAALVLRLRLGGGLSDSSSFVQLHYQPLGWTDDESISFTGFPFSSERFRLGYSYRLTWGGANIFPRRQGPVPGVRAQVTRDRWYAWVGGKSAVLSQVVAIQDERAEELVTNYGFLSGAGVDILPELRLEGGYGYFTRGTNPRLSVRGEPIIATGGSVQLAWHEGRDVGTSIDLRLYRNDPQEHQSFFRAPTYGPGMDYVIKTEFTWLVQTLEDPDEFGSTLRQGARAGDINFAMRAGMNRFFADAEFRDLAFILFNVPSFVPFQGYTQEMKTRPEWFIALGYDRYISDLHLTPGVRFGVQTPATITTDRVPQGVNPPNTLEGTRTVVVPRAGELDILPPGQGALPIIAFQANARLDISESMAALGEIAYEYDPNRATFREDQFGETTAVFVDPNVLSFNLVLQARF